MIRQKVIHKIERNHRYYKGDQSIVGAARDCRSSKTIGSCTNACFGKTFWSAFFENSIRTYKFRHTAIFMRGGTNRLSFSGSPRHDSRFSVRLEKVIAGSVIKNDPVIKELLIYLDQRKDAIVYAADFTGRTIPYISQSCEPILGYSARQFIDGGPDFFFKLTEASIIPYLVRKQMVYIQQAKAPGFDPYDVLVAEFPVVLTTRSKGQKELLCLCVVLTYSSKADFEFAICTLINRDPATILEYQGILGKIKERHSQIHLHPPFQVDPSSPAIVHVSSDRIDKKITRRETEVLKLLAAGHSTLEITLKLHISENTAETHRRHLLEKFQAKNSAELIKKASKVFWLE